MHAQTHSHPWPDDRGSLNISLFIGIDVISIVAKRFECFNPILIIGTIFRWKLRRKKKTLQQFAKMDQMRRSSIRTIHTHTQRRIIVDSHWIWNMFDCRCHWPTSPFITMTIWLIINKISNTELWCIWFTFLLCTSSSWPVHISLSLLPPNSTLQLTIYQRWEYASRFYSILSPFAYYCCRFCRFSTSFGLFKTNQW